ncbi:MAG: hypothetical protein AAFW83_09065 [Pseudomonadota bacterium]
MPVLAGIGFALIFTGSNCDGFFELAFGRVFKIEIQAFAGGIAHFHVAAQLVMKLHVAAIAFEIIKNDDETIFGVIIKIFEERNHALALHEVTAA